MFGSNANNSAGNAFGSGNNNVGGGLFGSKPSGTGFGSSSTASGNTGLGFGSSSSNNTNTGGGLFGANQSGTNNANKTGGGLFGANKPNQASGGLFSNANNSTTGFGATNNANTTQSSGGLFGSNTSNQSGGLFGGNNNSASTGGNTGGLFGNKQASGGGLFGSSTSTNTNNNQSGVSGGLIGNGAGVSGLSGISNTSAPGSGGLFGSTSNSSGATGGLFGSNNAQNSSQANAGHTLGLANNSQPSFSWGSQNQSSGIKPTSTLGNLNTTNSFISNGNINSTYNSSSNANNYTPAINDQLIKIKEQWDPNSGKCVLKTHFYNKLSDQEANALLNQPRPANESPEDWDNAMSKRPGPQYYPIKITSFTDIAQRIEVQLDHVAKSRIILNSINEKLSSLSSKHDLDNTTRILRAKAKHAKLLRRLLRLATVLAILKLKGYPLLPEEEEISKQFDLLNQKLSDPSGSLGKLNDVFARLAILKERAEDLAYQVDTSSNSMSHLKASDEALATDLVDQEDNKNDDEVIKKLSKLLLKQQVGLNRLNDVLEKDLEAVHNLSSSN